MILGNTPEEKKIHERVYQRYWGIVTGCIWVPTGIAAIVAEYTIDLKGGGGLIGGVLLVPLIALQVYLPEKIGFYMASRAIQRHRRERS
ncbi:MAG: hypothetical protein AAFU41_00695 [Pseudomonadota bacterium]